MTDAVIIDIVRTPSGRGKPGGALSSLHPASLLALAIEALLERTGVSGELIDDVIAGCVTQADDQAFNIGRTATLLAGLPESVPATTIDRQCGSSQQAAHFAAQGVIAGAYDVVIAGGVETMSRVPMGANARNGAPWAPLATRYPDGLVSQGVSAELVAQHWKIDRAALDAFAAESHHRAAAAAAAGDFDNEIIAVRANDSTQGVVTHMLDETIRAETTADGLAQLRPSFYDSATAERFPEISWQITPGNSSPLTDGASAALVMSADKAAELGLTPRARFHSFSVTGSDPLFMLTGVISATQKILARSGLSMNDLDAYEVNEAFACVPLAWAHEFNADLDKLNPRGGAISLGHPLGASGTRILATMLNHLEATGGQFALQTMCEGGGMANATIIERL